MGSFFRSEPMQLSQLFLHIDAAYMCISELGELGLVQFRDTVPETNAFQRKFVNEVRRCDEMERKLRFLEKEIKKDSFPMLDTGENPEAPAPREIIDLESTFEKLENEMKEVNTSAEQLRKTYLELSELKQILRKTQVFFEEAVIEPLLDRPFFTDGSTVSAEGRSAGRKDPLEFLAGVIHRERLPAFERMLWRACRGNVFLKQAEIDDPLEDPTTGNKVNKSVFLVFFQGDQLRIRVKKICEGFHATLYPCPDSQTDRREMAIDVMGKIEDLETVLSQTQQHRQRILETAAKNIRVWFIKVRKIKAIYHTLNLFNLDVTTKCMVGECWFAVNDLDKIHLALRRGMERSNSTLQPIVNGMSTHESPPTYHRTTKFTAAFQTIVDAYGVARYREVNPALFTVITFPFLFAVMFGDAGHGLLMFLFALWMVVSERKLMAKRSDSEIWNTFFGGRYIILLMGLFSIYTGLIYNDIFSRSANIFGSSWYPVYDNGTVRTTERLQLDPRTNITNPMYTGYPYPFGLDPIWQLSTNKITFTNSLKMKMSIVLGVLHMLFGISLSFFNHKFFNDRLAIWCEFIPQILFLSSIFFYLIILIFYKWVAYTAEQSSTAPSLLIGLINMVRFSYSYNGDPGDPFYPGQQAIQVILMVLALLCVPWMLLTKPIILLLRHRALPKPTDDNPQPENAVPPALAAGTVEQAGDSATEFGLNEAQPHTLFARGAGGDVRLDMAGLTNAGMEESAGDHNPELSQQHDRAPLSASSSRLSKASVDSHLSAFEDSESEKEFDFGDLMVHQAIHTIEYCLGCISNTASYLRLWALSLAHAQLSEVLWSMVMTIGLGMQGLYGCVVLFFIFAAWATLTIGVLLIMEGLSAFLHALRLHWVEFQNKFYSGTGYSFVPFCFESYINVKSDD